MKLRIKGVEYDADPSKLSFRELLVLEKATGLKFKEILAGLGREEPLCLLAFGFALCRRSDPALSFEDFDFELGDLVLVPEPSDEAAEPARARGPVPKHPTKTSG